MFKQIFIFYFLWRLFLVVVSLLAVYFLPLAYQDKFLGGVKNYFSAPWIYGWANFDGEHYLSIAMFGYKSLEQAFFPVYPKLIALINTPLTFILGSSLLSSVVVGLVISNVAFVITLILLFKLICLDFKKEIAVSTIIVILLFPTSFYFGALYSESLFLLFAVTSFFCSRKEKWLLAGIFGCLAAGTRVFGILLLPALLIEAWQQKAKIHAYLWLLLIVLGLGAYMFYQQITVGDALAFYNLQKIVGEQHQSGIVLIPQVFYRYIKMFFNINIFNPFSFAVILELLSGIIFFVLPFLGLIKKIRLSYLFFAFFGFLLPTVQGSFSSSPRYVIVLFPSFLVLALILKDLPKWLRVVYYSISIIFLCLATAMFLRGYWIA